MICAHCKTEYVKSKPNQFRYCSKECRLTANKPKSSFTKVPEFDKRIKPGIKHCKKCGKDKPLSEYRHRVKANNNRSYGNCMVCESNYEKTRAYSKRAYLKQYFIDNPSKRNIIRAPRSKITVLTCPETGKLFTSHHGLKYSHEGRVLRKRRLSMEHYWKHKSPKELIIIKCKECESTFTNKDKNKVFCCVKCADRYSKRITKSTRRARLRRATVEIVDPFIVFKKYQWRCPNCKCHTPRSLIGKGQPNTPELDHIIPLSRGGQHSYMNTQLLCRQCNNSKSDKIININQYKFQYEMFA